jgi:hypothetical protein
MQRWRNIKLTGRIMANPMATFAAAGFAFGAADCAMRDFLGRDDVLTGMVGGAAAGAVMGLRANSGGVGIKYGALFAGEVCVWGWGWGACMCCGGWLGGWGCCLPQCGGC